MNNRKILFGIVILAFLLRAWNPTFPFFTSDEARIAYRGHTLSNLGEDELGRKWPVIFNSSQDYQLPLVSYITAIGEIIPGPIDITARLPFLLIGTLLVFTSFFAAKAVTNNSGIALINAFLIATSPALIFLSKAPNENILLVFLLTLLFYFLAVHPGSKFGIAKIVMLAVLLALTSKLAWFIIPPFSYLVLKHYKKNERISLTILAVSVIFLVSFMLIPQGLRSLKENNLPLFSDVTVGNGINYLRGEGLKAGVPPYLEKILFNKVHFLTVDLLNWLSYFAPNLQFTGLDPTGVNSFSGTGAWVSVLIIPFFGGLIYLVKLKEKKAFFLLWIIISLIYPGLFSAGKIDYSLIILCLPFVGIIISLGLFKIKKNVMLLFLALSLLGVWLNNFDLSTEKIKASLFRPQWIHPVVLQANLYANKAQVLVSDDIFPDAVPFFQLYGGYEFKKPGIEFPYLVRVDQSTNIKFLLNESKFNLCKDSQKNIFLITKRDFDKISSFNKIQNLKVPQVLKTFSDNFGTEKAFLLSENICLKQI